MWWVPPSLLDGGRAPAAGVVAALTGSGGPTPSPPGAPVLGAGAVGVTGETPHPHRHVVSTFGHGNNCFGERSMVLRLGHLS